MTQETTANKPGSIEELRTSTELKGTVKRIELYGAFVDIGVGVDGLLHISQLGKPNVRNVEDVVKTGEEITVYVLKVDLENRRIALSLVKPPMMSWDDVREGTVVTGQVVRLEKFGVFVEIGAERPGMIHVSELANGYVNSPSDVVKVGDDVRAQIIKVNRKKKRIDLSLKALEMPPEPSPKAAAAAAASQEEDEYVPTAMELALRRAMEANGQTMPERETSGRGGKKNKRGDQKRKREREMEDIFERTLRGSRR